MSSRLRAALQVDQLAVNYCRQFSVRVVGSHDNHSIGSVSCSVLPTDRRVLARMKQLVLNGVRRVPDMQHHIRDFVENELFANESAPPASDSRFWPNSKTILNCIYRATQQSSRRQSDNISMQQIVSPNEVISPDDSLHANLGADPESTLSTSSATTEHIFVSEEVPHQTEEELQVTMDQIYVFECTSDVLHNSVSSQPELPDAIPSDVATENLPTLSTFNADRPDGVEFLQSSVRRLLSALNAATYVVADVDFLQQSVQLLEEHLRSYNTRTRQSGLNVRTGCNRQMVHRNIARSTVGRRLAAKRYLQRKRRNTRHTDG